MWSVACHYIRVDLIGLNARLFNRIYLVYASSIGFNFQKLQLTFLAVIVYIESRKLSVQFEPAVFHFRLIRLSTMRILLLV